MASSDKAIRLRYVYAAILMVFFIISFACVVQHSDIRCSRTVKTGKNKVSVGCGDFDVEEFCHSRAFSASSKDIETNSDGQTVVNTTKITCPYNAGTSILVYLSIIAAIVFVVLFIKVVKSVSPLSTTIIGAIAVVLTFISMVMMADEIAKGATYIKLLKAAAGDSSNVSYPQGVFIVNVVFSSIAMVLMAVFTAFSYKEHKSGSSQGGSVVKVNSQGANRPEQLNAQPHSYQKQQQETPVSQQSPVSSALQQHNNPDHTSVRMNY